MANKLPSTARKRGRPRGSRTEIGKLFVSWPFGEWLQYVSSSDEQMIKDARAIRNVAYSAGIGVSVLSDRENKRLMHVLKIEKEKNDDSQEQA